MDEREARWAALMLAARGGDGTAYAALLREIAEVLRGVVRRRLTRMGLGPDEAEDVVQEALIGLHAKRHTWDAARPILPWVHAIARYKMLDAARRLGRTRRATADLAVDDLAEILAAPGAERDLRGFDAAQAVADLPAREQAVVTGLALEGASVAALAERMAVSEVAIRVAFHRGLARLRRRAEPEDDTATRAA